MLTGISVIDLSSAEQAARWFLDRGATIAMITRGPHGAVLVGPDGVAEYPAFPATPVDTTAAGDAFSGALGAAWPAAPRFRTRCAADLPPGRWRSASGEPAQACPPPRQSMRYWPPLANSSCQRGWSPGDHRR